MKENPTIKDLEESWKLASDNPELYYRFEGDDLWLCYRLAKDGNEHITAFMVEGEKE